MRDLGIDDVRDRLLEDVPLAIHQRTEIARALVQQARVFLFDEPNSALTEEESNDLFRRMHALADAGRVVILVSHRLAELVRHANRVVVILDGKAALTLEGEALTQEAIARELVVVTAGGQDPTSGALAVTRCRRAADGRAAGLDAPRRRVPGRRPAVPAGEVAAFVGVEGRAPASWCAPSPASSRARARCWSTDASTPGGVAAASGFVSADRSASLFSQHLRRRQHRVPAGSEITGSGGSLRRGRMQSIASEIRDTFRIKTPSLGTPSAP